MKSDLQNEFVRHEPCPACPSSDAFAVYSDGSGYCFSCGHHTRGDGSELQPRRTMNGPITLSGDFARINNRNLTEETCRKFNVRVDSGPVIRFPYYSSAGRVVAYKERPKSKEFHWVGKNEDKQLFGQQLWGSGKTIVVCEGEFDCLSVFQSRPTWPAVSVPNGAHGAKKAVSAQLNFLMGFASVIFMFDNDEAGIAAAEECVQLFPHGQAFLASLAKYKDASEALQANDSDAIRQACWNKRTYTPKSIVDGRDLFDLVSKPLHGKDADYPFPSLNHISSGLRLGELVTCTAGSGSGKSTWTGEIAQSLVDQGFKVGYIALEENLQRTALRLMSVKANKPLHLSNEIPREQLHQAFNDSVGSGNVYLRDGFGSIDHDEILADIRYLVKNNEVQWIILDHLSILLSGNESHDERKTIDIVMTKLRSFVAETNIGMILISHLRRNQGDKGHEDGAQVSMSQLRGSHSIAQLSDLVIGLQRDISSGEPTSQLVVLKNRFNGQTGPAGTLTYNKETGRLQEEELSFETPSTYDDF